MLKIISFFRISKQTNDTVLSKLSYKQQDNLKIPYRHICLTIKYILLMRFVNTECINFI